jgi:hypothetical protein
LDVRHRALWVAETEWFRIAEPQWSWRFQAGGEGPYDGPEPEIAALLAAVEALDLPARAAWASCSRRVFGLAYDFGTRPFSVRHDLSAGTLARLAAVGATLRITLSSDPETSPAEPCAAPDPPSALH